MSLRDKCVAITGGIGGIGIAIARHFLRCGATKVALLDIGYSEDVMTKMHEDYPQKDVIFHLTDVTKKDELRSALQEIQYRFGAIDILVAAAGILDEQYYADMVNVNLLGVIHSNYIAMKLMSPENGGRGGIIINMSSVAGIDCSQFSSPVYNATKHAVVAFTRSMGNDFYYDKFGVKFITVCPGVTLTDFIEELEEQLFSPEAFQETNKKLSHVPKQTPEHLAAAIESILPICRNGSVWHIDGGKSREIKYQNHWCDSKDEDFYKF